MLTYAKKNICRFYARYKAPKTYPDKISLNISDLLSKPIALNIAIIDDEEFVYKDAILSKGHKITQYDSYFTKKPRKDNLIPIDLSKFDIILCDINGVDAGVYSGSDGLSVMSDIREKHPLHVIAAYTGSPGSIYKRESFKTDMLDKIFSRDWEVDDFLLNLQRLTDIFIKPKDRWNFIKKRLNYLGVDEEKIDKVRIVFSENILYGKMLNEKFKFSPEESYITVSDSENRINISDLTNYGITAVKIGSLLKPVFTGTP
ncbi:hypothetical protein [Pseudomonas fluorescens]|uniref:Response regulatory domain-containing protein n=1 Tax=Pseudomonas fluorescens TaxID=294 RepID=A0A5E7EPF7_PSEFL|nr:hypothetical protein [Pseudomonas fluorescens]VVO29061.1 hypothetical protein PS833_04842 [Pseudomonas fluorescens]